MKKLSRVVLRYAARSVNILNLLLLGLILAAAWYALYPLLSTKVSVVVKPPVKTDVVSEEEEDREQMPSISDFMIVADQNLYHPERRIPPEKKPEKELPRPELALYGTILTGDMSLAYIEDKKAPKSTPGRGKRQQAVKIGDNISGFVVKEIRPTEIILMRGEESMTVHLDDASKTRSEETTRAAAPATAPARTPSAGATPTPVPRASAGATAAPAPAPAPVRSRGSIPSSPASRNRPAPIGGTTGGQ